MMCLLRVHTHVHVCVYMSPKIYCVMSSDYDQCCPEIVVSTVLIRFTHCESDISVHVIKCLVIVYISLYFI